MPAFTNIVPLMYGEPHPTHSHVYTRALIFTGINQVQPFVVTRNFDTQTNSWDSGTYYRHPDDAYRDFAGIEDDGDDDA